MRRKPRKCRKCGSQEFFITEKTSYLAKIDGNRHVIAQSIHTSELEALYCRKCGHPLPHNALEFDTVSLTA